jgi:hypothetical protein
MNYNNPFEAALEKQGINTYHSSTFEWIYKEIKLYLNDKSSSEEDLDAKVKAKAFAYWAKTGDRTVIDPLNEGKSHAPKRISIPEAVDTAFYMHPNVPTVFTEWHPQKVRDQVLINLLAELSNTDPRVHSHNFVFNSCPLYADSWINFNPDHWDLANEIVSSHYSEDQINKLVHLRILSSSKIAYPIAIPLNGKSLKDIGILLLPQDNQAIADEVSEPLHYKYRPNIGLKRSSIEEASEILCNIRSGKIKNPYKDRQTAEMVLGPYSEINDTLRSKDLALQSILAELK